jgi:two-component system KDP operon response regulator KdpE
MKVLIIEDSADVVEAVSLCLQLRWPDVVISSAIEGTKGIEILRSDSFDIIILDINLPDIDGFEVLGQIRSFSNVPILIASVRGQEEDQVRGLEMGADDYIVKPFRPRDLIARVNAALRRSHLSSAIKEPHSIIRGKLTLKLATNEAQLGEEIAKLTLNESRLLCVLMNNADHTLDNTKLLQEVWGEEHPSDATVRTYIRRLRDKLKDKPPRMILNQRGGGYRFVSPT